MARTQPFGRHRRLTALATILALAPLPWIPAWGRDSGNRNALLGMAPSVAKTFDPVRIAPGGTTLVTLTLTNPNSTPATLTAELDDALPSPMVIGGGAGTTTCPDGNVSAIGGFAIFALGFGAQIPAEGSCTVAVCVTTDTAGMYVNTIPAGALQTDSGNNVDSANAMLDVTVDVIFTNGFDRVPGECNAGVVQI
jgi:hypothetical protein